MKRLFNALKWVFIICAIFAGHAYLTGNTHIFKTLSNTILKGRFGPGVDTWKVFPNRKVNAGKPQPWAEDSLFGKLQLSDAMAEPMKKYQTLAFVVIRHSKIIYENYEPGYSASSYTNPWSVTKSIVSLLTGVAIREGKIKSLEQPVEDFLPEYEGTGLKIRHLVTMSSGINFKEQYSNPYGYTAKALYGDDLHALNHRYRVNNIPGKHFIYLSGNTQVLGLLLEKATGRTLSEYASEKLWRRIGAEHPAYWSLDHPKGTEKAFCCFHSNARDLARIGQLMLQRGIWGIDTIISPDYYAGSLKAAPLIKMDGTPNKDYGYGWWLTNYKGMEVIYARGINGQYVIAIPARDMVIVRLGRAWNKDKSTGHHPDTFAYIDAALSLIR